MTILDTPIGQTDYRTDPHLPLIPPASPDVTIVIPMYNEAHRIDRLCGSLARWRMPFSEGEVVFVDDGSSDETLELLDEYRWAIEMEQTVVKLEQNAGKGAAVAAGVAAASGQFIAFLDADMAVDTPDVNRAVSLMQASGADVAVGNRRHEHSRLEVAPPFLRRVSSRMFRSLVSTLGLSDQPDTQCGFKVFRREAAELVFADLQTTGFAFDVELLVRATQHGLEIIDVPVEYFHGEGSGINPVRDGAAMVGELLKLRRSL